MNDIILNRKKIIRFVNIADTKKRGKNTGYTSEQIHKLLSICDERTKAIVLIYASTGMRLAALPSLTFGDLDLVAYRDPPVYQITVYAGYKEEYITFCTPECSHILNSYLSYRQRCGEVLQDKSPLIREQFNAQDPFKVKYPKSIAVQTIAKTLRHKLIQAGIRIEEHIGSQKGACTRKDVQLIHGFRKFFNTALMNADVTYSFKELLMGHSIKLDDVYYDKNNQKSRAKLLEEYSKAIDYLTISEENRLREKVEQLTVKKSKMDQLQAQIDRLNSLIGK